MLDDITVNSPIELFSGESITLNMNGHDLFGDFSGKGPSEDYFIFLNHSKLNITGEGTIKSKNANNVIYIGGSIEDVEDYSVCTVGENVTVKNISATIPYGIVINCGYSSSNAAYGARLTVDGTVEAPYGLSVSNNMEQTVGTHLPEITIGKTGKILADGESDSTALYASGYALYNIDGTLTGCGSAADDDTLFHRALHAVDIATEASQGRVGGGLLVVSHGDDVVELLVLHLQPAGHCTVDDRLELSIDGVEVDRAGQHQHIGVNHLLQDLCHVVPVDTFAAMVAAVVAAGAG